MEAQEQNNLIRTILPKLFISLPLRHRTEDEVVIAWNEAIQEASKAFYIKHHESNGLDNHLSLNVIDSLISDFPDSDDSEIRHLDVWCLGRSIQKLAQADFAYFAKGWKDARGCLIEHAVADHYGIEIITYEEFEQWMEEEESNHDR